MRISINKRDPAYVPFPKRKTYRITVGGQVIRNVITADTDLGMVLRAITTPKGEFVVNPITKGVATQRLYGHVVIQVIEEDEHFLSSDMATFSPGDPT